MSLSLYVLAGFFRARIESGEASMKYFLLGAFASGFFIYGVALIYGATGSTNLERIGAAVTAGAGRDPLLVIGFGLLLVGFGFKISSVPFHMWASDVYEGAPTPVTAFIATGSKAAAFAALLRVLLSAVRAGPPVDWTMLVWVLAVLSMTLGNVVAIAQQNLKRMLAYSSIAHAGYILVGAIANNETGHTGIIFYLLSYIFMNVGAFGIVALLAKSEKEYVAISDYRGLAYHRPVAAIAMAIFMFSLSGIPPTAGFLAKFYVFNGAVQAGYIWLVILGVINSMISLYYYLGIVVVMFMQEPEGEKPAIAPMPAVGLALAIAVFGTLNLGLFPGQWMDKFQELARSLM
jgi:NADH-quinone oxidoreductase subunit N